MDQSTETPKTAASTERPESGEAELAQRANSLITNWAKIVAIIEQNRDAEALDVTPQAARDRGIVNGNETYIGRRVIAGNIQREMPTMIKYISGSYRHITAISLDDLTPTNILSNIETAFTKAFRTGNWLDQHIQAISSNALHGRGVFMVIPAENDLGTKPVYVPPEDFVFPLDCRDLQSAPMVAVRYMISYSVFKKWQEQYKWKPEAAEAIVGTTPEADRVQMMFPVFLCMQKVKGIVESFWFSSQQNVLLTTPAKYNTGFYTADGMPIDAPDYPIFPVYYQITENPKLIERKGRAHADMHDQEALTSLWTSNVNASMRSSEVYTAFDSAPTTENPEVTQTDFIIDPGKIIKRPIKFFSMPHPDGAMLTIAQALKTENAAAAGQTDYAVINRQDSRKTATELDQAKEQSSQLGSVALTMFASGYRAVLQFQWLVLTSNIRSGYNTKFMANDAEARQAIATNRIQVAPAGDVDYVERTEKLKLYTSYYEMFKETPVGIFFLKKILELAFPKDYDQMAGLLTDNSKQMGTALLHILEQLPPEAIPPETAPQLQTIIAEAQKVFGAPQNAQTAGAQGGTQPAGPRPAQGIPQSPAH